MKPYKELSELRKELKAIGFKVSTERLSIGRFGRVIHIESKKQCSLKSIAAQELYNLFKPAFELIREFYIVDNSEHIMFV
jgi:hypothetical protein